MCAPKRQVRAHSDANGPVCVLKCARSYAADRHSRSRDLPACSCCISRHRGTWHHIVFVGSLPSAGDRCGRPGVDCQKRDAEGTRRSHAECPGTAVPGFPDHGTGTWVDSVGIGATVPDTVEAGALGVGSVCRQLFDGGDCGAPRRSSSTSPLGRRPCACFVHCTESNTA